MISFLPFERSSMIRSFPVWQKNSQLEEKPPFLAAGKLNVLRLATFRTNKVSLPFLYLILKLAHFWFDDILSSTTSPHCAYELGVRFFFCTTCPHKGQVTN